MGSYALSTIPKEEEEESHLIILRGNTNSLSRGAGAGAGQPFGLTGRDPVLASNPTTASLKLRAVWQ